MEGFGGMKEAAVDAQRVEGRNELLADLARFADAGDDYLAMGFNGGGDGGDGSGETVAGGMIRLVERLEVFQGGAFGGDDV